MDRQEVFGVGLVGLMMVLLVALGWLMSILYQLTIGTPSIPLAYHEEVVDDYQSNLSGVQEENYDLHWRLSRVESERDAALRDVARLEMERDDLSGFVDEAYLRVHLERTSYHQLRKAGAEFDGYFLTEDSRRHGNTLWKLGDWDVATLWGLRPRWTGLGIQHTAELYESEVDGQEMAAIRFGGYGWGNPLDFGTYAIIDEKAAADGNICGEDATLIRVERSGIRTVALHEAALPEGTCLVGTADNG